MNAQRDVSASPGVNAHCSKFVYLMLPSPALPGTSAFIILAGDDSPARFPHAASTVPARLAPLLVSLVKMSSVALPACYLLSMVRIRGYARTRASEPGSGA